MNVSIHLSHFLFSFQEQVELQNS